MFEADSFGFVTRSELEATISRDLTNETYGIVLFIDMDDFKPINDQYGHKGGDSVLVALAQRLRQSFGEKAEVCRYCSDEFIVYLAAIDTKALRLLLNELHATLSAPIPIESVSVRLTASMGVYRITSETGRAAVAIQAADIAMGRSKRQGGGVTTEFSDALWQCYQRELSIKSDLHTALNNNELGIVYQPIVDCKTHEIVAAEALVRWHREDGTVPPSEFVSIAEQSRQIVELNQYILRQAICEFAKLAGNTRLSVNIPASQLHATDLVAKVKSLLDETGLPSKRLYLELTETELVITSDHVLKQLQGLRELGVGIALDDFGTGYSNLQYLQNLPVDLIKLDRSFIENISDDAQASPLTNSILAMLNSLGKYLIVEGIENDEQASYLRRFNVDALQGFYFYKPMKLDKLISQVR
jgi:diguanylate cyclase (GGDEF)-like protein